MRLDGRVALVTGSTRGIGWATAKALAAHGATVLINGRSDATMLDARVTELRATGATASGYLADAADPDAIAALYRQLFKEHRRLDVLVNNAGVLEEGMLGMIPRDAVDRGLAVNLAGPLHHVQTAARLMRRGGGGAIVNITSIMGTRGAPGLAVYAASKAGLVGLTLAAAKELAPDNIRVNAVAPGFIDTDMARALPAELFAERLASVRTGRIGTPEDVAHAVLFLASDLSSYVTGQVLGVDGGMTV